MPALEDSFVMSSSERADPLHQQHHKVAECSHIFKTCHLPDVFFKVRSENIGKEGFFSGFIFGEHNARKSAIMEIFFKIMLGYFVSYFALC